MDNYLRNVRPKAPISKKITIQMPGNDKPVKCWISKRVDRFGRDFFYFNYGNKNKSINQMFIDDLIDENLIIMWENFEKFELENGYDKKIYSNLKNQIWTACWKCVVENKDFDKVRIIKNAYKNLVFDDQQQWTIQEAYNKA